MQVSRRAGFIPALALSLTALALGACGVKGELEAPKSAKLAASDSATTLDASESPPANPAGPSPKIFTSKSEVKRVGTPPIIPSMPPKEWTKESAAKKKQSPGAAPQSKSNAPDKPFILDWLL